MAYIKEGVCRCKPSYAGNGALCGNDKVLIRKAYFFVCKSTPISRNVRKSVSQSVSQCAG